MSHPLNQKPANLIYVTFWILVSITHFSIFYFYYEYSLPEVIADIIVFDGLYFGLGLAIYYLVRFNPLDGRIIKVLINHLVSAILAVFLWASLGQSIIGIIPFSDIETPYQDFINDSTLNRSLVGFAFYALFTLSFYLIEYYENMQERIREELELKSLANEAQLKSLKSQINPHFLFNSLNSINSLTLVSPEKTSEMVVKLSEFLRYSAGKQNLEHATLEEELRHMNIYLDIEKVRFGEKLQVETQINDDCKEAKIPNFILQPLLENAIKFGVQESLETKPITVSCNRVDNFIRIEIRNFFDTITGSKGEGIGINNIKERLKILYGRDGLLQIGQEENIYCVTIEIPQEDEPK